MDGEPMKRAQKILAGTSSAISILTMLLFIVLLLLEFKFVEKGVYYEN